MTGDPYTAPPPARPYARRGRRRPGQAAYRRAHERAAATSRPTIPSASPRSRTRPGCSSRSATRSSTPRPAALDEGELMDTFTTVMMSSCAPTSPRSPAIAGRPVTADDVEPMTWLYYESSAAFDGGAYVHALNELHRWTRRVVSWWIDDGFDLLLTPTLAEPPPAARRHRPPGRRRGQRRGSLDPVRRVPGAVQRHRPARDVGSACTGATSGLPIGVQLVARAVPRRPADPRRRPARTSATVGAIAARPCTPSDVDQEHRMTDLSSSTRPRRPSSCAPATRRRSSSSTPRSPRIEKLNPELNAVIHPLLRLGARRGARRRCPTVRSAACRSSSRTCSAASRATRSTRACSS